MCPHTELKKGRPSVCVEHLTCTLSYLCLSGGLLVHYFSFCPLLVARAYEGMVRKKHQIDRTRHDTTPRDVIEPKNGDRATLGRASLDRYGSFRAFFFTLFSRMWQRETCRLGTDKERDRDRDKSRDRDRDREGDPQNKLFAKPSEYILTEILTRHVWCRTYVGILRLDTCTSADRKSSHPSRGGGGFPWAQRYHRG